MHGNVSGGADRASFQTVKPVVETKSADNSVGDGDEWFADLARPLLGKDKPGMELDCITGLVFGERNCQRYAAGHVKPPAYFLRSLLRSPQGWQWLCACMEGCSDPWWVELQKHKRMGEAADRAR